ncbi:MAG: lipoprotein [Glaciihabitans sp.]|nr:lipoprotein [Glaciihabitans sp.]
MRFSTRSARLAGAAAAVVITLGLSACASDEATPSAGADGLGEINVGALATPAGDILKWVSDNLADDAGLTIHYTEFTDYSTPNIALSDGSIDANLFQNTTFMETYNESAGASLVSVGDIYLPTAAFYSDSITSIDDLKDGATIAIPNDPTNEGRALLILAAEGVIEVSDNPTTLQDITANPSDFDFVEIENATLAQSVPDVDAAFVTAAFALPAGLTLDSAILVEGSDSPYSNILATTPELESDPRIVKLHELLVDPATQDYINETWGGLILPTEQ